jgi:4-diphosphocytidyl-2-C-methyl-D-erythritol kinase
LCSPQIASANVNTSYLENAAMRFLRCENGLRVRAPAKLNLFLEVLGKRTDGFHELQTLMISINLYDTLTFTEEKSGSIDLCVTGPTAGKHDGQSMVPSDQGNLVVKAARLLRMRAGKGSGVRIHLVKRIPVAAGLAGGSSDAAASLVALNRLWNTGLSTAELMELAAELGSDTSFFIPSCHAAVCRGRGEIVEPVVVGNPLHFVVARPKTGLSTAAVFSQLDLNQSPHEITDIQNAVESGSVNRLVQHLHNRLQPVAQAINTDIVELQQELSKLRTAGQLMSGSGTSCFAVCHSRRQAIRQATTLRNRLPVSVFVTQCSS